MHELSLLLSDLLSPLDEYCVWWPVDSPRHESADGEGRRGAGKEERLHRLVLPEPCALLEDLLPVLL